MKNIFTPGVRNVIFESVFISLLVFFLQNYLQKLWAPDAAAEVLKKQNYIAAKKDVYFEALNLVTRSYSSVNFNSKVDSTHWARIRGTVPPNEFEVNSCLNRLYIYSDNLEIPKYYKKIFSLNSQNQDSLIYYNIMLVENIKKDLANNNISILHDYEYIQVNRDTLFK